MLKRKKDLLLLAACFGASVISKAQSCDTTMFQESLSNGWSAVNYTAPSAFGANYPSGYITGSNDNDYVRKANYFDLSATSYTYLQGVVIKFLIANCKTASHLTKPVYFKVYDDNAGMPGNLIATAEKTITDIKKDVDAGVNTNINFQSAIALPSSKKFYVSVGVDSLIWQTGGTNNDSLSIASTEDDQVLPATAWEWSSYDSVWTLISDDWNHPGQPTNDLNINFWIFPYVSTTSAGCGLLPVNLISFNALRSNNDVNIKWEVSNEINMKGYSIEKADNNGMFKAIAFVNATNSQKNQTYTLTDRNAFSASTNIQYRIKQVNADGSAVYSRIISLNHNATLTDAVFQNPFSNSLNIQLTLASSQKVTVHVYDMQGRLLIAQQPKLYNAGTNSISLNTTGLKAGTYILKVNAGEEERVYKVVK